MRLIFFTCRLFFGIIKVQNLPLREAEAMKDKLRILLRIALVLLLVCGVTVGVLYANRDIGIPTD